MLDETGKKWDAVFELISNGKWDASWYSMLLECLDNIPYTHSIRIDENLTEYWNQDVAKLYSLERKTECSFLEAVIGLSIEMKKGLFNEFEHYNWDYAEIFWSLMSNLGLTDFDDEAWYDGVENDISYIVNRCLNRDYELCNGHYKYCLFYTPNPKIMVVPLKDWKNRTYWLQANWWSMEVDA